MERGEQRELVENVRRQTQRKQEKTEAQQGRKTGTRWGGCFSKNMKT